MRYFPLSQKDLVIRLLFTNSFAPWPRNFELNNGGRIGP
jgi:hypothetical protein